MKDKLNAETGKLQHRHKGSYMRAHLLISEFIKQVE